MAFTTSDNVRIFLSMSSLTAAQEELIDMLIPLVGGVIENYCGWKMLATDYVSKAFDGNGLSELDTRVYPINSVTKILLDTEDITSAVKIHKPEGILIYTDNTFSAGRLNVEVDFNAGYNATNMPPDLVYAANYLVAVDFKKTGGDRLGISEETTNDVKVTYDSNDLPKLVTRVLDRYRLITIN